MSHTRTSERSTRTIISVDPHGKPLEQANIHTRWHPEIPAVATVRESEVFNVECLDFTGNYIKNNDCADDVIDFCWDNDHHLSGPIAVEGAEPGDVLAVDILNVAPFPHRLWGFSLVDPGLGPLYEKATRVAKSIWDINGGVASSRHIRDVEFSGRPHCGVIGTAPSAELLATWTKREAALNQKYKHHGVVCALEPTENGAYVGQDLPADLLARIKSEGARTKPAREHGGNIDSNALMSGSRIYLPVFVPGANLSVGDLHFNQGDGEPTCALEIAGIATLRCCMIKDGIKKLGLRSPMVLPSPAEPFYRQQFVFHGLSIDTKGQQQRSDLATSFIQSARHATAWLERFGYTHEQAYMIMAAAPTVTRVLAVPNIPTANVSMGLPTEIFKFDIRPTDEAPIASDRGKPAFLSPAREEKFWLEHKQQQTPFERP